MYRMLKLIQTKAKVRIFITSMLFFFTGDSIGKNPYELHTATNTQKDVIIQQVLFDANNISTWFYNTGMFNQDLRTSGTPGFQWPKGTGKFSIYSSGLCIGAYVNNELRESMASYKGEYAPGYVSDSAGHPVAKTDARFKVYSVRSTDGYNNPDWLNWGFMTAFGAPFVDVNHNGIYEWFIDTPGVKGAAQTLFASLTDGFPEEHKIGEGFGGGTTPLYADVRMTAWSYTAGCLADVIFVKWLVINRSQTAWNKTYFSVFNDNDLGDSPDDYNGCDTVLQMGYTYNGSDMDGTGQGVSYGLHPPAVGTMLLSGAVDRAYSRREC